MVAGHLQERNGLWYMVLNLYDEDGKRRPKWIPTDLPVRGNRKRAEAMLLAERAKYVKPDKNGSADGLSAGMYFEDYMTTWYKLMRSNWAPTTYTGYRRQIEGVIAPYFRGKKIRLMDLQPEHLQEFYRYCIEERGVSGNTAIHYHANIHKALKYAVKLKKIPTNPADAVERPKKEQTDISYYNKAELYQLLDAVRGDWIEFGVIMAGCYGLRREEVVGLRWEAVDFENNRILINHTVTVANPDGELIVVAANRTKNSSSRRAMPLIPGIRDLLLRMKAQQEEYMQVCGNCYNYEFQDYIYVNQMGALIHPDTLSRRFKLLIKKNGLKPITFHGLRHSCASLLLKEGANMKDIQEWLGHSNYSTTANIYTHLDEQSKIKCASLVEIGVDIQANEVGTAGIVRAIGVAV